MRYVFVYGTLRAGEVNDMIRAAEQHGIAAPILLGMVALPGTLYDFGRFPGMVGEGSGAASDDAGDTAADRAAAAGAAMADGTCVWGDLYAIDERLVPVLDEIEAVYPGVDSMFVRREIDVEFDGRRYPCIYYPVTAHEAAGRARIESGDWVEYRRERDRLRA